MIPKTQVAVCGLAEVVIKFKVPVVLLYDRKLLSITESLSAWRTMLQYFSVPFHFHINTTILLDTPQ